MLAIMWTMQWLMLQQEQPEDFVIATGRQESVRRFIELTAQELGWGPMQWHGEAADEVGRRGDTGAVVVRIDQPCKSLICSIPSCAAEWFSEHQPTVVVLAAAKVGGIHANNTYPADFLLEKPQDPDPCD